MGGRPQHLALQFTTFGALLSLHQECYHEEEYRNTSYIFTETPVCVLKDARK
jgi:hypothetical protein